MKTHFKARRDVFESEVDKLSTDDVKCSQRGSKCPLRRSIETGSIRHYPKDVEMGMIYPYDYEDDEEV